ncbi:TetR/AcrR family transcriptional regulator [Phreatobacter sp. AB_2022a]|uniref:TetR/AcrR family transcriptional regulator n=1 Tax=Phreatobacter sp. AB_2022a TaxID=3003134 RepID=UPI0022876FA8|nr:TetR/AcrR family transcriptional regulator [Phreatobacter sp. AB_2022a]MCZ0735605.1 TetR/AcrR family transcriptional regulator [Phreatobacter sp. AB_2022a]
MPVISAKRMQDRRDSILAAAKQVFAEKGFEATSIADIARAAGISDGLAYRYFQGKRDLLNEVLRAFYERTMVDLEIIAGRDAPFETRLHDLIHRHLFAFVADADLCRLFISEVRTASDYQGSPVHELNRRYTSILVRIVEDGVANGEVRGDIDIRLVRDVIFGAIEHRSWAAVNGRPLDVDATARNLVELLRYGLVARPQTGSSR